MCHFSICTHQNIGPKIIIIELDLHFVISNNIYPIFMYKQDITCKILPIYYVLNTNYCWYRGSSVLLAIIVFCFFHIVRIIYQIYFYIEGVKNRRKSKSLYKISLMETTIVNIISLFIQN